MNSITAIEKRVEKVIGRKLTGGEFTRLGDFAYNHDYSFTDNEIKKFFAA